jgi:hypothetical protein
MKCQLCPRAATEQLSEWWFCFWCGRVIKGWFELQKARVDAANARMSDTYYRH